MSEWWTYRPSDFLMFSAASHARLLERYNQDVWPMHVVMLAAGLVVVAAAARPSSQSSRWLPLLLAGTWGWVAWGFLWSRFAEINTAARYLAFAFAIQAGLFVTFAAYASQPADGPRRARVAGASVAAAALLLWPLAAPLTGRGWAQAEYFGLAPEPTALATLGWLLGARPKGARWLMVIPVVSMVLGLGMLWLLYAPDIADW